MSSEGSFSHWRTKTRSFHRQQQDAAGAASSSNTSTPAPSTSSTPTMLSYSLARAFVQELHLPFSTRSIRSASLPTPSLSPSLSTSSPSTSTAPAAVAPSTSAPTVAAPTIAAPTITLASAVVTSHFRDSMSATGRKRKANFSNEETETLVQHVVKHFSALYGSEALRTESTRRNQRRSQLWNQIQKHVNELGYTPRSIDDLKHKWRDLRLDVKRKITSKRSASSGTSGTLTPNDSRLTPMEKLVASTIGHHSSLDGEQDGMYLDPGTPRQSIFLQCRAPSGMCELSRGDRLNSTVLSRTEPRVPEVPAISPAVVGATQIFIGVGEEGHKEEPPDGDGDAMLTDTDIDIKPCPDTDINIKICPDTDIDIKPCLDTDINIKICPDTDTDIKPCLDTDINIKICPDTDIDIKPCLDTNIKICPNTDIDIKPCPETDIDIKPCPDMDIDIKPCPDMDIDIKPCPTTWPPVEEDANAGLLPGAQDVPSRCDSQGSMISSPEDSLGHLSAHPDWGQEGNAENPTLGLLHGSDSLRLKEEEEEEENEVGGGSQGMEMSSLPGGVLAPPTWQEHQEEWEQQSGSPQRSENAREDSLPSSASQEGDNVLAGSSAMPERADCSCMREERRTMWRTNVHRLLELEEQWDHLYHQELVMWEEDRLQQREQRAQDRELQLQLLSVLTDIRDELKHLREQRAASQENQTYISSSGEAPGTPQASPVAVEQPAIPILSSLDQEQPALSGPGSPDQEQPATSGTGSPDQEQPVVSVSGPGSPDQAQHDTPSPSSPGQPAPPAVAWSGSRSRNKGRSRGRSRIH
ncbi:uncharacterized protein LOC115465711 isoform X2 [Microcaecilia unicolor]|uniref:Uncharacterized protein LOC115465711 isoform X2 n=1 Tax=Microcaecilia unicolor TaxID=1415580 RepID=A0A6P7XIM4_9AMPH|nr:uncharacterized protein LOC115465711 isoform X2 [Microcaecilia unicolor]